MTTKSEATRTEAIERIRDWGIKTGDMIYVFNKHTSASGMSRSLSFYKIENDQPIWLSYQMAHAGIGRWNDKRETCDMQGCGMDMGFAAVYELSRLLNPSGFGCIGNGCQSNDHSNGDSDYTPHVQMLREWDSTSGTHTATLVPTVVGVGHWHTDGGYALKYRWLS